jgi:hypothetical protein
MDRLDDRRALRRPPPEVAFRGIGPICESRVVRVESPPGRLDSRPRRPRPDPAGGRRAGARGPRTHALDVARRAPSGRLGRRCRSGGVDRRLSPAAGVRRRRVRVRRLRHGGRRDRRPADHRGHHRRTDRRRRREYHAAATRGPRSRSPGGGGLHGADHGHRLRHGDVHRQRLRRASGRHGLRAARRRRYPHGDLARLRHRAGAPRQGNPDQTRDRGTRRPRWRPPRTARRATPLRGHRRRGRPTRRASARPRRGRDRRRLLRRSRPVRVRRRAPLRRDTPPDDPVVPLAVAERTPIGDRPRAGPRRSRRPRLVSAVRLGPRPGGAGARCPGFAARLECRRGLRPRSRPNARSGAPGTGTARRPDGGPARRRTRRGVGNDQGRARVRPPSRGGIRTRERHWRRPQGSRRRRCPRPRGRRLDPG